MANVSLEGLGKIKTLMTLSGIETMTTRLVALCRSSVDVRNYETEDGRSVWLL
jgi:hypothetical protein